MRAASRDLTSLLARLDAAAGLAGRRPGRIDLFGLSGFRDGPVLRRTTCAMRYNARTRAALRARRRSRPARFPVSPR